jgi:small subunit ribosomal protein S6
MHSYETVIIARQEISPGQVEALTQTYTQLIESEGGKIEKTEFMGLRLLAYRINKNKKGHYVLLQTQASPEVMREFERQMKLNEDVLRFLITKIDPKDRSNSKPSLGARSPHSEQKEEE